MREWWRWWDLTCFSGIGCWIFELFSLVVAKGGAAVVVADDVVRIDGDLAAASGGVDDVLGDGVAAGVATQPLDDGDSFFDAGSEM